MAVRNLARIIAYAVIAVPITVLCQARTRAAAQQPTTSARLAVAARVMADTFTPVVVRPMGPPPAAVPGTDGLYHVVYELELSNTKAAPATLQRIDVLEADAPSHVIASYAGKNLLDSLRTLQPLPAADAVIPVNSSRLFYVELTFRNTAAVPRALVHRLILLGGANPGPRTPATPLDYTVAQVELDHSPLPVLGPPLAGPGWLAANGCCNSAIVHRGSVQSINGRLYNAQRFAIDWMRIDKHGELVHGDPAVAANYADYGAKVLAVADGTVIDTLDTLDDQAPGKMPDPTTITLQTVDGNHVVLDIGRGLHVFYGHLKKGSVVVHPGEHIKKGMVIGQLGNTGNTSAPHLHIHLVNGPSALASQGMPYVIADFALAGQIDRKAFDQSDSLVGDWGQHRLKKAVVQKDLFPLNLNIVDFAGQ